MGEDEAHARVPARGLEGVPAQRGDAAPRVHQHREAALVREGEHRREAGVVERELLGARMELDAARAAVERALGLGGRVVGRVEAAEGEQAALAPLRLLDHHVVRRRVAVELVHGEDERARVDPLQRADQLLAAAAVAVGVVEPDVRVGVERLEAGQLLAQPLEPRQHAGVRDHGRSDYVVSSRKCEGSPFSRTSVRVPTTGTSSPWACT